MNKKAGIRNCSSVSSPIAMTLIVMLLAMFMGLAKAHAGTTGLVDIYKENRECNINSMHFDNNSGLDADGEGRGQVNVNQKGDVLAKCSYSIPDGQEPQKATNTSFDCTIHIDRQNLRASTRKATLNTNGRVDITCKAKIDPPTNDFTIDTDDQDGKGQNKGKKSN